MLTIISDYPANVKIHLLLSREEPAATVVLPTPNKKILAEFYCGATRFLAV